LVKASASAKLWEVEDPLEPGDDVALQQLPAAARKVPFG
jgi:hypothetical protein